LIILDSSIAIEFLIRPSTVPLIVELINGGTDIAAPMTLDLEVMNVMRKQVRDGLLPAGRAIASLDIYYELSIDRYPTELLSPRIWELRNNMTSYDASYVALAEMLEAPLYTYDSKLDRASGHTAKVIMLRPAP
jgi:predicted nucleic acid-binding protein